MQIFSKKYKEQGQVLVFAIVILIILLIASLFLFDLHSIIRSKIKLETAEQSAALAAANWQKHSLNLIGEINYAKAVDSLLSDFEPYDPSAPDNEQIASACRTLTEMQARISFCGPLIALGAAQQAAKNNGINIYVSDPESGPKSVYSDFDNYLRQLNPESLDYNYGDIDEYLHGYKWQIPYVDMLSHIVDQGLAVRPNGRFPGLESIDPPWLSSESLYRAIMAPSWCDPSLNSVIKYPDSYWNGKWYNIDFAHTSFPDESEIYTLGVNFSGSVDQATLDYLATKIHNVADDDQLAEINWCVYDNNWLPDSGSYDGPNNDNLNLWSRGEWLRDNLKENVLYGGAIAYAECYQEIKLMSKYKSKMKEPTEFNKMERAAEALGNDIVEMDNSNTSLKVGNDSATDNRSAGSVAKPIGSLDGRNPTDAIIVLPVFTDVALIPSSMQSYRPLRVSFSALERFLIWFADIDDLHSPSSAPPVGTEFYLTALQRLDDETFRKSGWNNDYVRNDGDLSIYFNDDYKYNPESNTNGAGWLQELWVATDMSRDENASLDLVEVEAGWNTRIYSGRRYILRNRNGTLMTNEQMICHHRPGGPGGSGGGGGSGPGGL